mgnify:CR=1 FL=1
MRRRSLIVFIIINVFVSLGVVLLALRLANPEGGTTTEPPRVITVEIRITNTPDPNLPSGVQVVTATPSPLPSQVVLPTGLLDETQVAVAATSGTPIADVTVASLPAATIDPAIAGLSAQVQETASALPPNCVLHTLKEGEFPGLVAEQYEGVSVFDLLAVNNLTEESSAFLQIGQVLIVPLPGCGLIGQLEAQTQTAEAIIALTPTDTPTVTGTPPTDTPMPTDTPVPTETLTPSITPSDMPTATISPTPTETFTPSLTPSPTFTPSATIPPTAANAQVVIRAVQNAGDVTAEQVVIRNNGATVNLNGWTLRDNSGSVYTFGEKFLFSNAELIVFSGVGTDTPVAVYWGRDQAAWSSGESVILSDPRGTAQSIFTVP